MHHQQHIHIVFTGAGNEGTGIVLKGSSTVLNELAATNTDGKVTVAN